MQESTENPSSPQDTSTPAPLPPMSLGARLTNVVAAPGELFDYLKTSKESVSNWLVPALIVILVGWIGTTLLVTQDWVKPQIMAGQEANFQKQVDAGNMTEAQMEQALGMTEEWVMVGLMVGGYGGTLVMSLAGPFLWGLFLYLVGAKILRGNLTYMKAVEVAGLSAIIVAVGSIVKTLLIMIQGNLVAAPSAMLLFSEYDPTKALHAYAGLIDVMAIWALLIKSMGIARLIGKPTGVVAIFVFAGWLLFFGGMVTLGLLAQGLGGG